MRSAVPAINELEARYGRDGSVTFAEMFGGVVAVLTAADARAVIALQGAQVLSYETAAGEVLWLSPVANLGTGKAVRGGIPVCWTWFGPHGSAPANPAHGFVRAAAWSVVGSASGDGRARVILTFDATQTEPSLWPHKARAEIEVTLDEALTVSLTTVNCGSSSIPLTEALHTYVRVGDVAKVSVTGLDGRSYVDQLCPGAEFTQTGAIAIAGEVDRIYQQTGDAIAVSDVPLQRTIRVAKVGSQSTVIWNPGPEKAARLGDLGEGGYRKMVCVEAANAGRCAVALAPGERHRITTKISVARL